MSTRKTTTKRSRGRTADADSGPPESSPPASKMRVEDAVIALLWHRPLEASHPLRLSPSMKAQCDLIVATAESPEGPVHRGLRKSFGGLVEALLSEPDALGSWLQEQWT